MFIIDIAITEKCHKHIFYIRKDSQPGLPIITCVSKMIILGILGVFLTFETFLWDDDGNGHIWTYLFLFITRRPIFGWPGGGVAGCALSSLCHPSPCLHGSCSQNRYCEIESSLVWLNTNKNCISQQLPICKVY